MTAEDLLPKLRQVKRTGEGVWQACCPAHEDKKPSLTITQKPDRVLLHCHTNKCDTNSVCNSLGIEPKDLFTNGHGSKVGKSKMVATYDYTDAGGTLLYQSVRFEPKDFRQRRPDGKGGWVWKIEGVTLVPFRLPQIIAAIADKRPVFICE